MRERPAARTPGPATSVLRGRRSLPSRIPRTHTIPSGIATASSVCDTTEAPSSESLPAWSHPTSMRTRTLSLSNLASLAAAAALLLTAVAARGDELLVSAASSLTDAMTEIGRAYAAANRGTTVRFNFGASGALMRQIQNGAPVDVFVSASPVEMDALQRAGRLEAATRIACAGNRLVLIAP